MTRALCLALGLPLLAACSSVPEVATRESAGAQAQGYPALAPLDQLLASADAPSRAGPEGDALAARAAGLRARAAALRQR